VNSVLERIGELEAMLAQAKEAGEDVSDQQASLRATDDQLKKLVKDIQDMIEAGQSSGDPALDIVIMLGGTVVKGKPYQRLTWLQHSLAAHSGELVCFEEWLGEWKLAVIPNDVSIGWNNAWNAQKGVRNNDVVLPVGRFMFSGRTEIPEDVPRPIETLYRLFTGLFDELPSDESPVISHDLKLHIGDEKVQSWAEGLKVPKAIPVAAACRALGKPLKVWPELALWVCNLREAEIPRLLGQMGELSDLLDQFHRWQQEPAIYLAHRPRTGIEVTESGVKIDFGMGRPIKEARARLRGRVHVAVVLLEMSDNPTLQQAAKLVDYEVPG